MSSPSTTLPPVTSGRATARSQRRHRHSLARSVCSLDGQDLRIRAIDGQAARLWQLPVAPYELGLADRTPPEVSRGRSQVQARQPLRATTSAVRLFSVIRLVGGGSALAGDVGFSAGNDDHEPAIAQGSFPGCHGIPVAIVPARTKPSRGDPGP